MEKYLLCSYIIVSHLLALGCRDEMLSDPINMRAMLVDMWDHNQPLYLHTQIGGYVYHFSFYPPHSDRVKVLTRIGDGNRGGRIGSNLSHLLSCAIASEALEAAS